MNFPEGKDRMTTQPEKRITESDVRPTVQIHLPDGRVLEGPRGSQLVDFLAEEISGQIPVVGAIVNGELRELTYRVMHDAEVRPLLRQTGDGMRIYRRTLSFLLRVAAHEVFPDVRLTIDHALPFGGFYCSVINGPASWSTGQTTTLTKPPAREEKKPLFGSWFRAKEPEPLKTTNDWMALEQIRP